MTQTEWDKEARRLNKAISITEKCAKKAGTLAQRIEAQREVRELREQLRQHRLHFHELVAA